MQCRDLCRLSNTVVLSVAVAAAFGAHLGCSRGQDERPAPTANQPAPGSAEQAQPSTTPRPCPPSPAPISCPAGSGFVYTVVELNETSGSCAARLVGGDKLDTLRTTWSNFAVWSVCNRCSAPVDIRLRGWDDDPQNFFVYTRPMVDASNVIQLNRTCAQDFGEIYGLLNDGSSAPRGMKLVNYEFSWKLSSAAAWNDIDPRLEIERDPGVLFQKLLDLWIKRPGAPPRQTP